MPRPEAMALGPNRPTKSFANRAATVLFALTGPLMTFAAFAVTSVELNLDGSVGVSHQAGLSPLVSLSVVEHLKNWSGVAKQMSADFAFPKDGRLAWHLREGAEVFGTGVTDLAQNGAKADFRFEMTPSADRESQALVVESALPAALFAGTVWTFGDGEKARTGVFPKTHAPKRIYLSGGAFTSLTLRPKEGVPLRLEFDEPTEIMLQDNRNWSNEFVVRLGRGTPVRAADRFTLSGRIVPLDDAVVSCARPVVIDESTGWTPLDYRKDILAGSALDFSGFGLQDAPAGRHGWLRNVGGHFEFERLPGVRQRFYGVNLCFTANYPTHEVADRLVTRLVRLGYNALRIHHYESNLMDGKRGGMNFDTENLDRLDYLLARAIEKGLYVTTDLFVSRLVTWEQIGLGERAKNAKKQNRFVPMNHYKILVALWQPAFDDWCRFAERLLTHVNPYTGRSYVAEAGLPLISLVNEGQLTMGWSREGCLGGSDPIVRERWRQWLAERRRKDPSFCPDAPADAVEADIYGSRGAAFSHFMADIERESATRMRDFLRGLGVRALLTNANCGPHFTPMQAVREDCYDYVDDHFYIDHPRFLARSWRLPSRCGNANPVSSDRLSLVCVGFTRLVDKPFTVTEWNFSGPGMYRGVGGIMTGAFSALQDWDGLWRFTYAHARESLVDGAGIAGYFDVATDPLGQASDRASVLLFLRRDLAPLSGRETYRVTDAALGTTGGRAQSVVPSWERTAWTRQVSTAASASPVPAGVTVREIASAYRQKDLKTEGEASSAFALDSSRGSFVIAAARTAGGFTPEGRLVCGPIAFDVKDVPATVWVSSVDREPTEIRRSKRLLVTHLTDVQAKGNVYADRAKTTLLKWGCETPLVRNGSAAVELELDDPSAYAVWSLETSGRRLERIPNEVRASRLCFTASVKGPCGARMLYEVARRQTDEDQGSSR